MPLTALLTPIVVGGNVAEFYSLPSLVVLDLLLGTTLAAGIVWALGPARLPDGTIVRYLPAKHFTTEIRRTSASDGLDY